MLKVQRRSVFANRSDRQGQHVVPSLDLIGPYDVECCDPACAACRGCGGVERDSGYQSVEAQFDLSPRREPGDFQQKYLPAATVTCKSDACVLRFQFGRTGRQPALQT